MIEKLCLFWRQYRKYDISRPCDFTKRTFYVWTVLPFYYNNIYNIGRHCIIILFYFFQNNLLFIFGASCNINKILFWKNIIILTILVITKKKITKIIVIFVGECKLASIRFKSNNYRRAPEYVNKIQN